MVPDLVYDVGMNNGDDSAYYLARGYRVVAIEADPTLIEDAQKRFAGEIRSGRLRLINAAVGPEDTTARFWICPKSRVWNSFDEAVAGRNGLEHYAIEVPVRRFRGILAEHGTPHYLKVDIEGYDRYCLEDISPDERPTFVSWEMAAIKDLFLVQSKGYNAFQCISQSSFEPIRLSRRRGRLHQTFPQRARRAAVQAVETIPAIRPLARAARRALRGPSTGTPGGTTPIIKRIVLPQGSWSFPFGSSGPFGPDLGSGWKTAEEIAYQYMDYWLYNGSKSEFPNDWFDVHATTLDPAAAPSVKWSIG